MFREIPRLAIWPWSKRAGKDFVPAIAGHKQCSITDIYTYAPGRLNSLENGMKWCAASCTNFEQVPFYKTVVSV